MSGRHPSFLELDRVALGEAASAGIQEHLSSCTRCQAHMERAQRAGAVPAWVGQIDGQTTPPPRHRWLWAGGFASAALAAAIVFLFVRTPTNGSSAGYTTVKGSAAVAVHINRGNRVSLWDGHSKVMPADALRLEVVPDGYRYVGVFAETNAGATSQYIQLYAAPLPDSTEPTVLPKAWEVDTRPGPETIIVIMSNAPIPAADLPLEFQRLVRDGAWVQRLTLYKQLPTTELP
jgi:hypothetical protein